MNKNLTITIDGSEGEGGGQVLRTALALSMITGTPFEISNIRAKRSRPGLLRQHLTAVNAAAHISGAQLNGAELGSQQLQFTPDTIRGGNYEFAIGSAGSCMLVLQTILPALWFADAPSNISISGGTHNKAAPPAHFLSETWHPLLQKMGVQQQFELKRYGFYPAGGGLMHAQTTPAQQLTPLHLPERGKLLDIRAEILHSQLPGHIAERERAVILEHFPDAQVQITKFPPKTGPGNVILIHAIFEHIHQVFCGFGEKKLSAEKVAYGVIRQTKAYLDSTAVADEYLADQLLLPMALAGSGSFTTQCISSHFETNACIIQQFLPVQIHTAKQEENGFKVEIHS